MNKNEVLDSPQMPDEEDRETPVILLHPCTQEEFNTAYQFTRKKSSIFPLLSKRHHLNWNVLSALVSFFPVFEWLPRYNFKSGLLSDLISGFTVAVMHIPQGMAYAALGSVNPIVGVYMAMFPVLVYFLMGTSRHISMGTFSIVCMMAGKPVLMFSSPTNTTDISPNLDEKSSNPFYSPLQVASVICFTVGLLQVLLGLCKVGSLSMFMSESLVSGFTTGAAVLVFVSQLEHVLGVNLSRYFGMFNVVFTIIDLAHSISKTNYLALAISLSVMFSLLAYTNVIHPRMKTRCLLPVELIAMVVWTLISYCFSLNEKYSIKIIGSLPMGFPAPVVPPVRLIPYVLLDSIIIAIVSFSINISMANLFAIRDNYKINANQELVASGFGNMFGGFFSCLPMAASLSRSMIQYSTGGKTQLASVFSCGLLLSVIMYFGRFLEPLPYSVLAGIVIKSLQSMLLQAKHLPVIWQRSTSDGIIWVISFLSVIFLDIHIALGVSLVLSVLSIVLMNQNTYVCSLGRVPNTDMYLEIKRYPAAKPLKDFVIIQIYAGLHFANIHVARNKIERLVNEALSAEDQSKGYTIVIDMSAVSFIDPSALHALHNFIGNLKRHKVNVCLTRCTGRVYEEMSKCDFFKDFSITSLYPTIQDAVLFTLKQNKPTT